MARIRPRSPRRHTVAESLPCCAICGSDQVVTDEVWERGLWQLSECRRCAHQWTDGPFGSPRGPVARIAAAAPHSHAEAA